LRYFCFLVEGFAQAIEHVRCGFWVIVFRMSTRELRFRPPAPRGSQDGRVTPSQHSKDDNPKAATHMLDGLREAFDKNKNKQRKLILIFIFLFHCKIQLGYFFYLRFASRLSTSTIDYQLLYSALRTLRRVSKWNCGHAVNSFSLRCGSAIAGLTTLWPHVSIQCARQLHRISGSPAQGKRPLIISTPTVFTPSIKEWTSLRMAATRWTPSSAVLSSRMIQR